MRALLCPAAFGACLLACHPGGRAPSVGGSGPPTAVLDAGPSDESPAVEDAGTPHDRNTSCNDGAPYCTVDLAPGNTGRALRTTDDGRVIFFKNADRYSVYSIYDPGDGRTTPLLAIPWTYDAVASGQGAILYGVPYLSNAGCWVHVFSVQNGDRDLGPPPICAPLVPIAIEGPYALVEAIGGGSPATDRPPRGLLHVDGTGWIDLGTLGGDSTVPAALNADGTVAGSSKDANGVWHAFLWRDGVMSDMKPQWGAGALAIAPDGNSVLLGPRPAPDGSVHDLLWRAGAIEDLGIHPEFDSLDGKSLGTDGKTAVGSMSTVFDLLTPARAFLYEAGVLYDLNTLVASHALHLEQAASIATSGTIAATARSADGSAHPVMLVRQHPPAAGGGTSELPEAEVLVRGQRAAALALDDERIYWINQTGSEESATATFEVRSALKSGADVRTLASGAGVSADLAVSATHVYITALACGSPCRQGTWHLLRVSKSGGALELLGGGVGQIALDDTTAYVSSNESDGSAVLAYPFAGGPPLVLARNEWLYRPGIAVSSDRLYYDTSSQSIASVPKGGETQTTLLSTGGDIFFFDGRMKLSGDTLFFRGQGALFTFDTSRSKVGLVAEAFSYLRPDIDVDGTSAYWNSSPTGSDWSSRPFDSLGCLHRTGSDGESCLSHGIDDYLAVRTDSQNVYFIRVHQILRLRK
jgi:probable HAF family extracellular repeat protein